MSAPFLIVLLGVGLALATYVLRVRSGPAFWLAAAGSALLGAVALGVVLGEPFEVLGVGVKLDPEWSVLGRSLVLSPGSRVTVGFVLLSGGALLLAGWAAGAPRRLAPLGLLMLVAVSAALMVEPFVFSPTLLAGAAIVGSVALVRPEGTPGRGTSRLLIVYVLAMMAILIAGWLIETGGVAVSPEGSARSATILLGVGLAIVAVTPPFHTWLTAAADEAHPAVALFLALVLQTSGLFLLLKSLGAYAWMRGDPLILAVLRGAGLFMIAIGGAWSLTERRAARVAAYALIVDFGVSLLAMSTATASGYALALGMVAARYLGGLVCSSGLGAMTGVGAGASTEDKASIETASTAAAVLGGLSLAGFPLTAGFAGRWMTLSLLRGTDPTASAAVLLAIVVTSISAARGGGAWAGRGSAVVEAAGKGRRVALWIGAALVLMLGLAPALLYGWTSGALASFGGLVAPPVP